MCLFFPGFYEGADAVMLVATSCQSQLIISDSVDSQLGSAYKAACCQTGKYWSHKILSNAKYGCTGLVFQNVVLESRDHQNSN